MLRGRKAIGTGNSVTAESIAKALKAQRVGGGWVARCPAHEDRKPSLSIREADGGRVLVYCHAGCDQARVISALRSLGLWEDYGLQPSMRSASHAADSRQLSQNDAKRTATALAIWNAVESSDGSLAETYLAARRLHLPLPSTLRFHPGLKHPSGDIWPAMVALVTRGVDDARLAIHRTFLARDGSDKAPVDPQKMMLGPCGAVRLAPAGDLLMVGEGIETSLAAMQATRHPAWAALSTSGMLTLDLPAEVRDVIVLADGDDAGEAAAENAALRWKREGRRVRIARPPRGCDFNDMLQGRVPNIGEAA
jgi:putative DNA primase/helicase